MMPYLDGDRAYDDIEKLYDTIDALVAALERISERRSIIEDNYTARKKMADEADAALALSRK